MIKLGIIGAENSHSYSIAKICNIDKAVPMRATHLWGESEEVARVSAEKGGIANVVQDWRELLGRVDGVMIDHRDGKYHYDAAKFFIENRIPTFVDKPLTGSLQEAEELLALADLRKTPVCSFSVVPLQKSFRELFSHFSGTGTVRAVNSSGPMDIDSPYGGIFFYGIHQIEAIVEIMGTSAVAAQLIRNGKNSLGTILFSEDRIATLNGFGEGADFHWRICLNDRILNIAHRYDTDLYLEGTKIIYELIHSGKVPWSRSRMLAPIAILEALQKSLQSQRLEKIVSIP